MTRYRVAFMGTPAFAVPTLEALVAGPDEVVGVITNPDRPAGRGKVPKRPPVAVAATRLGIDTIYQPRSARKPDFQQTLESWEVDLAIVVAYGRILPQSVLDVPRLGCINVHASVLPKLRGAAPINWAIVRGHTQTGVSIMQMDAGMDSGAVYTIATCPIDDGMTAGALHDRLMHLGPPALMDVLGGVHAGTAVATPQAHERKTRAPMIEKADGLIDWSAPARAIMNHVHGFNPWPGAFSPLIDGPTSSAKPETLKVHRARLTNDDAADLQPGEIAPHGGKSPRFVVGTGEGNLEVLECQAPGKKALDAATFLRGRHLGAGSHFQLTKEAKRG